MTEKIKEIEKAEDKSGETTAREFRISTKNLFRINRIVVKAGILKDIKRIFIDARKNVPSEEEINAAQAATGFEIAEVVMKALDGAESEVYELLADLEGKTPKEVEEQDFFISVETIKFIFNSEQVKSFLTKFSE